MEVAGVGANLQRGFEQLNIKADLAWVADHQFSYNSSPQIGMLLNLLKTLNRKSTSGKILSLFIRALSIPIRVLLFIKLLFKYDYFIFLYGNTITGFSIDYHLIRWMNKKCIVVFLGSDSRPPYMNGKFFKEGAQSDQFWCGLSKTTQRIKRKVQVAERYAHATINTLATSHFHTKPFVDWFYVGLPAIVQSPISIEVIDRPIRVLHAPSSGKTKGSSEIFTAVEKLRLNGYEIDFYQIENKSNAEVMQAIDWCDLVIDQLYSDTPLAGLACEAAARGKPSIVGSYLAKNTGEYFSNLAFKSPLFCDPDEFQRVFKEILDGRLDLNVLGQEAYRFVSTSWNCETVARKYLNIFENNVDQKYYKNPVTNDYVYGHGLNSKKLDAFALNFRKYGGVSVFGVDHLEKVTSYFTKLKSE